MYDSKTWERQRRGPDFIRRPKGLRTPCKFCPKCQDKEATPQAGRKATLSLRNWRTLQLYYEHQAAGGEVTDLILRKNFGTIAQILDLHERRERQATFELMRLISCQRAQ